MRLQLVVADIEHFTGSSLVPCAPLEDDAHVAAAPGSQGIIAAEELLKMQMAEKDCLVFTKDLRFRWSNSHGSCTNRHVENRTRDAISRAERNPPRLRTKEGLGYDRSKGLPFLIR